VRYNFGVTGTWFIGADLAWRDGTAGLAANETGAAVTGGDGQILDAGRTRGAGQTTGWADRAAEDGHTVMFADAPLVFASKTSQRLRETQAGQRYGRWKVSATTANVHSPRLAGMQFLRLAGLSGRGYSDGSGGSPRAGRLVSETCPYATLADAAELAMTPNGVAASASRRMFRPARGGPSALPTATR
jgi:predicted RNase H-like nuclease